MAVYLCDDGNAELRIEADSPEEAAQEYVDGGDWGEITETIYIRVWVETAPTTVYRIVYTADTEGDWCQQCGDDYETREAAQAAINADPTAQPDEYGNRCYPEIVEEETEPDDRDSHRIAIEPEEPECEEGEHEWVSPLSVVGGIAENPGCWGHGGGVIYTEVCLHCGAYRETDTWAQDRETGEQGLRSVTYRDADDESLAWVASHTATDED